MATKDISGSSSNYDRGQLVAACSAFLTAWHSKCDVGNNDTAKWGEILIAQMQREVERQICNIMINAGHGMDWKCDEGTVLLISNMLIFAAEGYVPEFTNK